ncbi:putative bifunctional diguanylate cyclase/phosphodiesterase [Gilvimarinus xylanilyticus]|uniref:Bifunctional diguanylate cyclase/phosphodiesterase n=1 Tax=Gilvimarinus xylanilyticus TaxID=2944139 RepID=A0A9X2KUC8_9GAMM|nr:bifunctional diguanylate cyclase/phosphodiesterase [Gilvimarinus xylanilyticus]MCP8899698.1 bifunctional diguanylate cyclase/phosphodiesterase [Gilvimarinus xylanilyticus]
MKRIFTHSARRITLLYVVFATVWILFSDQLAYWIFGDSGWFRWAQTFKGWLFIAITAGLLYGLLSRSFRNIERLTLEDNLCQLPNRVAFINALKYRCRAKPQALFTLTLLDIDHFTDINDSLGHGEGDRLISQLAEGFADELSQEHWYVARLGGDEFGVLSPTGDNHRSLVEVLDRVQNRLPSKISIHRLTLSAGTSFFPQHGKTAKDLMRNADMALSAAKKQGRDRHLLFHDQLRQNLLERLSLLEDLRSACVEQAFTLVYQPQWSLKQKCWIGAEVLLRWHHPERGPVSPELFIPLAEREGLIESITEFVFERALYELSNHPEANTALDNLSLNLSYPVLTNETVMNRLFATLTAHDKNRPNIIMEITETAAMENLNDTLGAMKQWQSRGVTFSIDDFGTGYSSLARLKQLPLTELKIDRSFIQDIPGDSNDVVLTRAILAMAQTLSLSVVAEGVETEEQAQFLQSHGCDVLQGYWLGHPVPIEQLKTVLAKDVSV